MSEFVCERGHISKAGLKCSKCGAKIVLCDGLTSREMAKKEKWEDEHRFDENEEVEGGEVE